MMNPHCTPDPLDDAQRKAVAAQLDALLHAVPEDGDGPLRARLEAYVQGLRCELPGQVVEGLRGGRESL
ncbi:hypothetical protein [uncultured Tessaracoccus sp.]|uniref:hypothetical protein n=1 Tax=uncultured Tessaracoccus sp. TaxID=905023 RepID=UPI0025E3518E|nr:hypothetical protein [uncultured Tessaracoccus sp.]